MTDNKTALIKWLKSHYVVSNGDPKVEPWNEAIDCLLDHVDGLCTPDGQALTAQTPVDLEKLYEKIVPDVARLITETKECSQGDIIRYVLSEVASRGLIGNVPEGYALVPIEPTEEMEEKGHKAMCDAYECGCLAENIYKAMLSVAPHPTGDGDE